MQLVFIYSEKYKFFEKSIQYCLDPTIELVYDEKRMRLEFNDKRDQNNLGANFFGKNIISISAFLGKNGSGKSTLIELMVKEFVSFKQNFIKVFRSYNSEYFVYTNILDLDQNFTEKIFKIKDRSLTTSIDEPHNFYFFYYSPLYDGNNLSPVRRKDNYENNNPHLIDFSTNKLVLQTRLSVRQIEQYERNEFTRMLNLFCSGKEFHGSKITFPSYLYLETDIESLSSLLVDYKTFNESLIHKVVIDLFEIQNSQQNEIPDHLLIILFIAVLIELDDKIENSTLSDQDKKRLEKMSEELQTDKTDNIEVVFKSLFNTDFFKLFDFHEVIKLNLDNLTQELLSINEKLNIKTKSVHFPIKEVKNIVNWVAEFRFNRFYPFEYIWSFEKNKVPARFSSGERMLLSLYSRLFDVKTREIKDNSIILILDEPDIGLHPQWQKQFLFELFKFIELNFEDLNFQIIITSHSPFIASDLPNDHVIYLGRDDNKNPKTFAANIHNLLADSFFMQDGFVGEFAKKKVLDIIEHLRSNKEEHHEFTKEYVYEVIDMIGEPTVRGELLNEFLKVYGVDKDERIEKLKKEIENLEKEQ